jgi:hypothetical protein
MASMNRGNTALSNMSSRIRFFVAAVALLALGVPAASRPAFAQSTPTDRFDVLGVKMNMPLVDARKILGAALPQPITEACDSVAAYKDGPTLRTRCVLHDGRPTVEATPNTVTQMMTGGGGQGWFHMTEQVDLDLSGANENEKVVFISRGMKFPKGQESTVDKVVAGLKQKYGETTSSETQSDNGVLIKWIYDQQGQLLVEHTPLWRYDCDISGRVGGLDSGNTISTPTVNWEGIAKGCGFAVVARVNSIYTNPQIAVAFIIVLTDQAVLFDALVERDKYLKAAFKAKQDSDAQKAKGEVKF